jgi:hypothetical protein
MAGSQWSIDGKPFRAALVTIIVASLLTLTWGAVVASPAVGQGTENVFVCKYVGTPGVDEELQTGNNPISVSVNAIPFFDPNDPDFDEAEELVGQFFNDQQGRSFVLEVDVGQDEPPVTDCPPPSTTTTTTTVTTTTTTTTGTTTTTPPGTTTTTPAGTTTTPTGTTTTIRPTTITPTSPGVTTVAPPPGTAFTGLQNVIPLGVAALALLTAGSGLLWAGTRRARRKQ